MRTLRAGIASAIMLAGAGWVACKYSAPPTVSTDDAPALADAYVPDSSACTAVSAECAGPTLRECKAINDQPVDTPCAWGCSTTPMAHCAKLVPSGGALLPTDLDDTNNGLDDKTLLLGNDVIDTDSGSIANVRTAGTGVINGIEYFQRGNVGVFRFKKLKLDGNRLDVRGTRALAIVGLDGIEINARIDATGDCNSNLPGAGGFAGGGRGNKGSGPGAGDGGELEGQSGNANAGGGGGGGYGGKGGKGGSGDRGANPGDGGPVFGDATITVLQGGGGGGGGGGLGGTGGGGGGAVQLVSNGTIRLGVKGVDAGGCGGRPGNNAGGGGGAGGVVLIEAPSVEIGELGVLAVNGGGGGAGVSNQPGGDGREDDVEANGGNAGNGGGDGGNGAAGDTLDGHSGQTAKFAGGGGGGVGWLRINTYSLDRAQVSDNAKISPHFGTTNATRGLAIVQ